MKTLNQHINEWRYNSESKVKRYTPARDTEDLKRIIEQRLKENPEEPYLLDIDISNVKLLAKLFNGNDKIKRIDISSWNTGHIPIFTDMFYGCKSLEYVNMKNLNFKSCVGVAGLFAECVNLKMIEGILTWKFGKDLSIANFMFYHCRSLSSELKNDIENIDIVNHYSQKDVSCSIISMFENANKSIIPSWYDQKMNDWKS